ncbi:type VII secretion target [Micromonospora sp. NPDC049679]|uniref:WXG100 family type VII secretion target n=1 Tax=Micromonospora sp. NPDC049679 TaxID=3155920 RepID=UPI0033DABD61
MGFPDALCVDVEQLRAVAGKVTAASETVGPAYTSRRDSLACRGDDGWSSVAAARTASTAWGTFVGQLAASVSGLAGDLRSAADAYQQADEDAAELLRRGGPVPR